jgi:AcrR family transcriptional regulator
MARKYELKQRAERQEETRRRIVEAAIELHRTKGPARTTLSDIARLAGVQRHTLYRHFADEREIFLACSGLYMELNPPPRADEWRSIPPGEARLRAGLGELYAWFERNADMLANVTRDAEVHPLTLEMFQVRAGESMGAIHRVLSEGVEGTRRLAALGLALDFRTWHRLAASGLSRTEAVETMATAVMSQRDGKV